MEIELNILNKFEKDPNFPLYYNKECFYSNDNNSFALIFKMDSYEKDLHDIIREENKITNSFFWKFDMIFKISLLIKKLHKKGFLHLDLNPKNILMMNKFTPVLTDFDNSLKISDYSSILRGKKPYRAPEIDNIINYKFSSDIYSLAGVFFTILTNRDCERYELDSDIDIEIQPTGEYVNFKHSANNFGFSNKFLNFYKIFENLLLKMSNENPNFRPSIDKVITEILKGLFKLIQIFKVNMKNEDPITYKTPLNYFKQEKLDINNSDDPIVLKYKENLLNNLKERQRIYGYFANQKNIGEFDINKFIKEEYDDIYVNNFIII